MGIVQASDEAIRKAAQALARGETVAFPTETVYGLGANALNAPAVAKIFAAKERPRFNPLIVHVLGLQDAANYAVLNDTARRLIEVFWPGPLSLVLPRSADSGIAELVSAGLDTVALRAPAHPVARALLAEGGLPIAAPSANRSGRISPTTAQHVEAELGDLPAMILDGGPCAHGLESTVIGVLGERTTMLRLGAVTREAIEAALGERLVDAGDDESRPASPGRIRSHYAPLAPVRLNATEAREGEAFLTFGTEAPAFAGPTINLSPRGDLAEAAVNFFAALRSLDASGAKAIAVMPIPAKGLGEAINDRLRRAAAAHA